MVRKRTQIHRNSIEFREIHSIFYEPQHPNERNYHKLKQINVKKKQFTQINKSSHNRLANSRLLLANNRSSKCVSGK